MGRVGGQELRELADAQPAPRGLAMLVARGEPSEAVFAAGTREALPASFRQRHRQVGLASNWWRPRRFRTYALRPPPEHASYQGPGRVHARTPDTTDRRYAAEVNQAVGPKYSRLVPHRERLPSVNSHHEVMSREASIARQRPGTTAPAARFRRGHIMAALTKRARRCALGGTRTPNLVIVRGQTRGQRSFGTS